MKWSRKFLILISCIILVAVIAVSVFCIYHSNNPLIFININDGTICIKEDNQLATSEWIYYNNNWYFFDSDKYMVRGIKTIEGLRYNFGENGKLKRGWIDIQGERMFINDDHTAAVGWTEIDGNTYFFDDGGVLMKGKVSINAETYSFDDQGQLLKGWQEDDTGNKYYVNQDGTICHGLTTIDSDTYLLDENGYPLTGWQTISGEKHYFNNKGIQVTGIQKIKDSFYTFDDKGKLITKSDLIDSLDEVPTPEEINNKVMITGNTDISGLTITGFGGFKPESSDINTINDTLDEMKHCKNIGFVMINLYNGKGIAYNSDLTLYSASCIKGPYVAALINYKPELLDKSTRSFEEIVINSDNKLYDSARRSYGKEFFAKWCEDCGVNPDVSIYFYPHISARSLAKLWIQNYYFFNTDRNGMKIRDWYTTPNQSSIYKTLGKYGMEDTKGGYRTESKGGWISGGKYNSTTVGGIIYPDDSAPYIISIISDIPANMDELDQLCLDLNNVYKKTLD